ncbi:replication-associated recombination protein A [Gottschalkiaceae bacterium SANA]|nr:replication-associated recombination protein A [Gottschalkiaceae bacterium SANA]
MDLFGFAEQKKVYQPLAERMRPNRLLDFQGQERLVGDNSVLKKAIDHDQLLSLLLFGPPGTGKTTLARILAKETKKAFFRLNAVTSGVKDIREVVEKAKASQRFEGIGTILFIDEIHRFNKSQQDALLPYVENGTVILIGATTENPYYEVNKALISRSIVLECAPLDDESIEKIVQRAICDQENGFGKLPVYLEDEAMDYMVQVANGDARVALNLLEMGVMLAESKEGKMNISLSLLADASRKKPIRYEKNGDFHYDVISAFIKSIRGSDPNAALYWLALMIEAGEDPKFICRRLMISAAEDVGNADPQAIQLAVAVAQGVERIGMPEGRILLAQATTYLASAPKSNASYVGINRALEKVKTEKIATVPEHLKDATARGMKARHQGDEGLKYLYPHAYSNHYVDQNYLPKALDESEFYTPTDQGYEKKMKMYLNSLREDD